jgi:hypothetical protein
MCAYCQKIMLTFCVWYACNSEDNGMGKSVVKPSYLYYHVNKNCT